MDARTAELERLRKAIRQAQNALAVVGEILNSNEKDDLLASNTMTNTGSPAAAGPPIAHDSPAAPKPATPKSSVAPEPPIAPAGSSAASKPPPASADPSDPNLIPRSAVVNMISLPQPKLDPRIGANIRKRTQQLMLEDRAGQMAQWEATKSFLAELGPQLSPYVSREVDRDNQLLHPREHPNHSGKAT